MSRPPPTGSWDRVPEENPKGRRVSLSLTSSPLNRLAGLGEKISSWGPVSPPKFRGDIPDKIPKRIEAPPGLIADISFSSVTEKQAFWPKLNSKNKDFNEMPRIGLEPTHRKAPDPKSGVSTNFTTWAKNGHIYRRCIDLLSRSKKHLLRRKWEFLANQSPLFTLKAPKIDFSFPRILNGEGDSDRKVF